MLFAMMIIFKQTGLGKQLRPRSDKEQSDHGLHCLLYYLYCLV